MMMKSVSYAACCGLVLAIAGCANESVETEPTTDRDGAKFLMSEEPAEAQEVIHVRENAKHGDDVLIVGRIGGGANPWIDGRAAFTIVDNSLKACSDIPGDQCEQPWDYCCETGKLPSSTALVKVVDEQGNLVKADARQLLHVKELSTVIARGEAQRDDDGNLTVLARAVYVKQK